MKKPIITIVGGGTGVSKLLFALKKYDVSLNAVISMADSGGSTGRLREQYGVSAVGDIRKAIQALATNDIELASTLSDRCTDGELKGHTIGNIMLANFELEHGSLEIAIQHMCNRFGITHNIIPVTNDKPTLYAQRNNGTIIRGESAIDTYAETAQKMTPIKSVWLEPTCKTTDATKHAFTNADLVVIGPGDFYTSIIPNFLVNGVREALVNSSATKVYFGALVTKHNETHKFTSQQFIETLESFIGKGTLDYALFNTRAAAPEIREIYAQKNAKQVKVISTIANEKPYVIADDFLDDVHTYPLNSAGKLAKKLIELL